MAEKQYRRLTRPRRRRGTVSVLTYTRSSLWLGADHLLVIVSNGYSETYKRFYFEDIQALTLRLTRRRMVWNWVLGGLTGLCLVTSTYGFLFSNRPDLNEIITEMILTFIFGVPLLLNNLFGPTCACTLRSAVQTEELPSLCRLRKTRRILDRLRPLITQAQGQLAPEEIPARLQAWTAAATATARSEPAPAAESVGTTRLPGENNTAQDDALRDTPPITTRPKGGDNTAQGNALGEAPPYIAEP